MTSLVKKYLTLKNIVKGLKSKMKYYSELVYFFILKNPFVFKLPIFLLFLPKRHPKPLKYNQNARQYPNLVSLIRRLEVNDRDWDERKVAIFISQTSAKRLAKFLCKDKYIFSLQPWHFVEKEKQNINVIANQNCYENLNY